MTLQVLSMSQDELKAHLLAQHASKEALQESPASPLIVVIDVRELDYVVKASQILRF